MREQRGRSRYLFIDALIGALIGIASPYGHAQCSNYQITTVDGAKCWPVGYASGGIDISESGVLCGETSNCSDGVIMLWTGGLGYESIVWPPDTQSWAPHGMNSNLVVVGYRVPLNEPEYPFMAINGDVIDLPFLPGDLGGAAHAISQDGRIVGYTGGSALHAVIWIEGEPEPIDLPIGPSSVAYDISETGHICGWMGVHPHPSFGASAFIWNDGQVTDIGALTATNNTEARAVNNLGEACGLIWYSLDPKDPFGSTERHGFFWSDGKMIDIGTLPGFVEAYAQDLNDSGTVVGYCQAPGVHARAFIWKDGGMTDLNDFIPPELELRFQYAEAINNAGQITGTAYKLSNGDPVAIILSPNPSTPGDYNCDKTVNVDDLLGIINRWGPIIGEHPADFTDDGIANVDDLMIVLDNWTF